MAVRRNLFPSAPTSASKRAKTTTSLVRRSILNSSETKSISYTGSHFTGGAGAPSSAVAITNIATGTGSNQRVGNKLLVTRIEAKLFTQTAGSTRVIIFCPKEASYTWLAANDIRTFTYNLQDLWVFYDKVHGSDGLATSTTPNGVININLKRNQYVLFNGAGGTNWTKNPIYIAFLPVNGASASASVQGYIRTYYKDI